MEIIINYSSSSHIRCKTTELGVLQKSVGEIYRHELAKSVVYWSETCLLKLLRFVSD